MKQFKILFASGIEQATVIKGVLFAGLCLSVFISSANANVETMEMTTDGHEHHEHMVHAMAMPEQLMPNPAFGDDIFYTQPAGMWMVDYKFMHTAMKGLRSGTTNVPLDRFDYGAYMMAPLGMTMDMHMVMVMYGVTDRFTMAGTLNYQADKMDMMMGFVSHPPVRTNGPGDTELRGIYRITDRLTGSLGLSIPTGGINKEVEMMDLTLRAPYNMQLGSGTFDLRPTLTYDEKTSDGAWNWGAQAMYTYHPGKNSNGYRLGDSFKATSWLQRALGPVTSSLRLAFNESGRISGNDPELEHIIVFSSDNDTRNYGGQRLDGLIGLSYARGAASLGVEGGVPVYQDLNGIQLKTTWLLNAGIQVMF